MGDALNAIGKPGGRRVNAPLVSWVVALEFDPALAKGSLRWCKEHAREHGSVFSTAPPDCGCNAATTAGLPSVLSPAAHVSMSLGFCGR